MLKQLALISTLMTASMAFFKSLDDYVNEDEYVYKWEMLADKTYKTAFGNTMYVLNVTSLQWFDTSVAYGVNGAEWTHLVYIAVPPKLRYSNASFALITNKDNTYPNDVKGMLDDQTWEVDIVAHYSQTVAIGIEQIPNQPYVYTWDLSHKERFEDDFIAYGWSEYLKDPNHDARWLLRLPMVKASFQCMRAAQDFLSHNGIAHPEGWVVTGASKRGWTTWDVAITNCSSCVKILAIAPQVPIIPDINREVHHMWQTLGGFTWAFQDYLALNLTQKMSTPEWDMARRIVDPIFSFDRLENIPKYVIVTSDDEFMQFEWSNMYYDKLPGEKHIYVMPNAEHEMITALRRLYSVLASFMVSVASGQPMRPHFDYTYDNTTGQLQVKMQESNLVKPKRVRLMYGETLSTQRRDFRWIFQSNNNTEPCRLPYIPVPGYMLESQPDLKSAGNLCIAPILWHGKELKETEPGVYTASPPEPRKGHWMGYFIEVEFPGDAPDAGDLVFPNHFTFTTPGFVWPNTMPFEDCQGEGCWSKYV